MNHHLPAGPPHMNAPAMPTHQPSRRQQEYHNQFHGQMAHSPGPMHNPYAAYGHPAYYVHPGPHMGYPPRWQQHQQYMPVYGMPPPQYPPRSPMSPMIVSSQVPSQPSPMTPVTRHAPLPYMPPPSQSPAPAPVPGPLTPLTPSSGVPHSMPSPTRSASVHSSNAPAPTSRRSSVVASQPSPTAPTRRTPFCPEVSTFLSKPPSHADSLQLPWYSRPDEPFPAKAPKRRRKRQDLVLAAKTDSVALPTRENAETQSEGADVEQSDTSAAFAPSTVLSATEQDAPALSQAPSEPVTPTVAEDTSKTSTAQTTPQPTPLATRPRRNTRTAVPIIPAVPNISSSRPKTASTEAPPTPPQHADSGISTEAAAAPIATEDKTEDATSVASPPKPSAPKSWADLVRAKNAGAAAAAAVINGAAAINGTNTSRASSVAEALKQFNVDHDEKIAFLEPRGLVNTGNMCYMNSVRLSANHCCHHRLLTPPSDSSNTCLLYSFLQFLGSGQQAGCSLF